MGIDSAFQWRCHPEAWQWIEHWIDQFVTGIPPLGRLQSAMHEQTGTRLVDWIDHLAVPSANGTEEQLRNAGFDLVATTVKTREGDHVRQWQHPGGMFPIVLTSDGHTCKLALKVESVCDFLAAHQIDASIEGAPASPLRVATAGSSAFGRCDVIERHGRREFLSQRVDPDTIALALWHQEQFRLRPRRFEVESDGFDEASGRFEEAAAAIGRDWACDRFFAAERAYWQQRNRAARIQKARQDRLGLGWANHDHHTYRSSRQHFARLVALLEQMGFECRERFYGGAEAGWGAQVLEQPVAGIVIFADVDLTPQEVAGDFAHEGLAPRNELGTVGLWCALHGEAMLQAGLHHLECQFDFEAARSQLEQEGVHTMHKFTDFPFLKQAFTEGEVWQVADDRIETALKLGAITGAQAAKFRDQGCVGSHLEILQRDDGYKGFNQTGISEIIRETDPRHVRIESIPETSS